MARWLLAGLIGCAGDKGAAGPGDTSPPADTDQPVDTGETGGETGEAPFDGWAWCPSAADAVTSGAGELTVTEDALYCALSNGRSLSEELARHLQVRIVPGTYAVPEADASIDYVLPVCLRGADPEEPSAMTGEGTLNMVINPNTVLRHNWNLFDQPLSHGGESWLFALYLTAYPQDGPVPPLVIDEELVHGDYPDTQASIRVCRGDCEEDERRMYPCEPVEPQGEPSLTVTFDRGEASFWLERVRSADGAITIPTLMYRAEGTLDGAPFAQDSYWDLAHIPDHHNKGGGFLARFPEPISGACGLIAEVPSEDGSNYFKALRAATIDCEGNDLEELKGVVIAE